MSYQQKKDAHAELTQSSPVAGLNTISPAGKNLNRKRINSMEEDETKSPGDELYSTVSLEEKTCPEVYTNWWLYMPESSKVTFCTSWLFYSMDRLERLFAYRFQSHDR